MYTNYTPQPVPLQSQIIYNKFIILIKSYESRY
jgi:hypothetical protein